MRRRLVNSWCVAGVLAALAGCNWIFPKGSDFQATAAISKSTISPGDTATISVTFTNLSGGTRSLETNPCPARWVILDSLGNRAAPGGLVFCFAFSAPRLLRYGEEYVFTTVWSGDTNNARGGSGGLAPGRYRLLARGTPWVSQPVTFVITPRTNGPLGSRLH